MKKIILLSVILILLVPLVLSATQSSSATLKNGDTGSEVYEVQRRLYDLGYLNYRPTAKFSDMTMFAVQKFQRISEISPTGEVDAATRIALFSPDAYKNTFNPEFKLISGIVSNGQISRKGLLSAWDTIDKFFTVGSTAEIVDYNSGITFNVKRVGGINSAHVITVSDTDYEKYLEAFGGQTWEHRAVLVTINGSEYAASLFGMPTGTETLNASGMSGYTVLYFNDSKSDINAIADVEHAISITRIS